MKLTLQRLRRDAIAASLFPPATLKTAIERLGFVQADPIRCPARAQDLILRQRVKNYRAGDLERRYGTLPLEEDFLYAYGFMPRATWELLHPRSPGPLSAGEERVLEIVTTRPRTHPRDLDAQLGRERELNGWGGYSAAATRALHSLHYRGLLRVAGRENGIRIYEAAAPHRPQPAAERLRKLILLIAGLLAPLPERSLLAALRLPGHVAPAFEDSDRAVAGLVESGELSSGILDRVRYVWPGEPPAPGAPAAAVRFLAPFDPLVWDRARFEHLWGWAYRFEAYTPPVKRKLGYYAMPLLWRDAVIGWVNVSGTFKDLAVEPGFTGAVPGGASFRRAFDAEVERMRRFLTI